MQVPSLATALVELPQTLNRMVMIMLMVAVFQMD